MDRRRWWRGAARRLGEGRGRESGGEGTTSLRPRLRGKRKDGPWVVGYRVDVIVDVDWEPERRLWGVYTLSAWCTSTVGTNCGRSHSGTARWENLEIVPTPTRTR